MHSLDKLAMPLLFTVVMIVESDTVLCGTNRRAALGETPVYAGPP